MIQLKFLTDAEAELFAAITYYSDLREGLGSRFNREVESAAQKALSNPGGGARGAAGTRRRIVKDFPFNLVYRASASELLIVAIAPHRRKPNYWSDRVK